MLVVSAVIWWPYGTFHRLITLERPSDNKESGKQPPNFGSKSEVCKSRFQRSRIRVRVWNGFDIRTRQCGRIWWVRSQSETRRVAGCLFAPVMSAVRGRYSYVYRETKLGKNTTVRWQCVFCRFRDKHPVPRASSYMAVAVAGGEKKLVRVYAAVLWSR